MKRHWKVLIWMVAGAGLGLLLQMVDAPAWSGAKWQRAEVGIELESASGPAAKAKLAKGFVVVEVIRDRATRRLEVTLPETKNSNRQAMLKRVGEKT